MKKFILLICFLLFSSQVFSQFATQEFTENFNYPAGDSLGAHGWVSFSGGATNRLLVTLTGLTYPGYLLSGIGNATTLLSTGQDAYKPFNSNLSSGNVYAAMMVIVDTGRTGDYFAALLPSTSTTNYTARTYVRLATNGNLAFGISKGAGGIVYSDSIYTTGTPYLLVSKYTFNITSTTDDSVRLFILSSGVPFFEPVSNVGPVGSAATDVLDLGRFALRQGTAASSPNLRIDGLAIVTSWENPLPVELASFTSTVNRRDVTLNWTTATENNNSGFEIERSTVNGQLSMSNVQWTKIGFANGSGTTSSAKNYSFIDRGLNTGLYNYRLKQIDFNANFSYFNLSNEVGIGVPTKFDMSQNYPNPFNPSTKINYDIPFDGKVSIKLFDMSGKEVATLVNNVQTAGYYTISFNASSIASGVYLYKISVEANGQSTTSKFESTKKMVVVK